MTKRSIIIILSCFIVQNRGHQPHIILFVADDWGYNDVGYHNPEVMTPNIDYLARDGVILEQSYVQPTCTPTRSALLTGYYPYHIGRQGIPLSADAGTGLTLQKPLLPQAMKQLGYSTHLVGKWHLGHCNKAYLPLQRGFDTHYGFWCGQQHYYEKGYQGYDFHDGNDLVTDPSVNSIFSSYLYTDYLMDLIHNHKPSLPMFLMVAFQNGHSPLEPAPEYEAMYAHIKNEKRRKFLALVTSMDDMVGNVTQALKDTELYNNSILIMIGDNGGIPMYGGSNWPLRGGKGTVHEGGVRTPGFIHSTLLQESKYTSHKKIHVTDWLPTILRAADATSEVWQQFEDIDGIDQYEMLFQNGFEVRQSFVYNIQGNTTSNHGAIRVGDFKLHVHDKKSKNFEVFNIKDDPNETIDLSSNQNLLHGLLSQWKNDVRSIVPEDTDFGVGIENALDADGNHITGYCEVK